MKDRRPVQDYGCNNSPRCEADWFLDNPVRYKILILSINASAQYIKR